MTEQHPDYRSPNRRDGWAKRAALIGTRYGNPDRITLTFADEYEKKLYGCFLDRDVSELYRTDVNTALRVETVRQLNSIRVLLWWVTVIIPLILVTLAILLGVLSAVNASSSY